MLDAEPKFEISLSYHCGCVEHWPVFRLPDEEPQHQTLTSDCDETVCQDIHAHSSGQCTNLYTVKLEHKSLKGSR